MTKKTPHSRLALQPRSLPLLSAPLVSLLLSACAPQALAPGPAPAATSPAATPARPGSPPLARQPSAPAQPAATAPEPAPPAAAMRIDTQASLIAVTVRRGGPLARLGHDHVVASRHIEGTAVAPANGQPGRADFRFRLDAMSVDDTALRGEAGMAGTPPEDAIAGTRRNMLTKVLDAEKFPYVQISAAVPVDALRGAAPAVLQADITLHGVTRRYAIPATLSAQAAGVSASGAFTLRQSDFGITPFSVLGGALAVQDQLELRFTLSARR